MIYQIDLDALVEIREKLGHPYYTQGRTEYRVPFLTVVEKPWADFVNHTKILNAEGIFRFNDSSEKWDFSIKM